MSSNPVVADVDVDGDDEGMEVLNGGEDINLSGNDLSRIPEKVINRYGSVIQKLDLTDNGILLPPLALTIGSSFPRLHTLILDKNNILSLNELSKYQFPTIETLWLNNNKLNDLNEIIQLLKNNFPRLTYLSLLCNPCCPNIYFNDGEADAYQRYRNIVIASLPNLLFLDSTPVTKEERDNAVKKAMTITKISVPSPSHASSSSSSASSSSNASSNHSNSKDKSDSNAAPRVATFLAKGRPRYDGTNSEGNRFIVNEDL